MIVMCVIQHFGSNALSYLQERKDGFGAIVITNIFKIPVSVRSNLNTLMVWYMILKTLSYYPTMAPMCAAPSPSLGTVLAVLCCSGAGRIKLH